MWSTEGREVMAKEKQIAMTPRPTRRGYLMFATDPSISPEVSGYREVYATDAKTPNEAMASWRPLTTGRRVRAYPATGRYRGRAGRSALGGLSLATPTCSGWRGPPRGKHYGRGRPRRRTDGTGCARD
jgi:hypothetical protein